MSIALQTTLQVMVALWFLVILVWPDFLEDDADLKKESDRRRIP